MEEHALLSRALSDEVPFTENYRHLKPLLAP